MGMPPLDLFSIYPNIHVKRVYNTWTEREAAEIRTGQEEDISETTQREGSVTTQTYGGHGKKESGS